MELVRWGMIGCGSVTEVKSGPALQKATGSRLVAVTRRTRALAEDYARRHGVPKVHADAEALVLDPEVDAVYIATPPGSHASYAELASSAGKPTYVEKPMARSAGECRRMNAAFASRGLPLFVAYYRRALPRFREVRSLLGTERLGTITGITYRYARPRWEGAADALPWRLRAEHAGGGFFMDLGCHTLDLLDFLFGPLGDVSGRAANVASPYDVEDRVVVHFRVGAGVPGTASWNFAGPAREDRLEITGTRGRLVCSTFGNEPLELSGPEGTEALDRPNPGHIQQPLIQSIVDELRGHGSCPSTGTSAARTAEVMDAVLDGYYGGRRDAFWERPERWPGVRVR